MRISRAKRTFKDRDYISTAEKLFFCTVGYIHPPERIVAYLKYATEDVGIGKVWTKGFRRVLPFYTLNHIEETLSLLKEKYPIYLHRDRFSSLLFSSVPLENVQTHYCPEEKLQKLIFNGAQDSLESKALGLVFKLAEAAEVDVENFGITGSILIGLHRPRTSDIDLTILGRMNSLKVRSALISLYKSKTSEIQRFSKSMMEEWCKSKVRLYGITFTHAQELYRRIWNRGIYQGTMFSIHPTRLGEEVKERYGAKIFQAEGMVEVEATVEDTEDSLFMPCTYGVKDIVSKSGLKFGDIKEVVSYEGLYSGIFNEGEKIKVKGLIEKVRNNQSGSEYRRILVGSRSAGGKDFIKPNIC